MKAEDGTATLDLALSASGLDKMTVVHRPRLLSDNGASYVAADLAHRQFPRAELGLIQRQVDNLAADCLWDAVPEGCGPGCIAGKSLFAGLQEVILKEVI